MEKARAGSELFLHGAFLRAVEIWDVRIGVYNIGSIIKVGVSAKKIDKVNPIR